MSKTTPPTHQTKGSDVPGVQVYGSLLAEVKYRIITYGFSTTVAAYALLKPGEKEPAIQNTIWIGKEYFNLGVPKGLLQVSKERGVDTQGMNFEDKLNSHDDPKIEHFTVACSFQ